MSLQESLEAMLAFLESNRKLDQKTFDQIEQMQVGHLLRQIQAISNLGQDEATALNERIKTSALNDASGGAQEADSKQPWCLEPFCLCERVSI